VIAGGRPGDVEVQVVVASLEMGAIVATVARRRAIRPQQLFG
jgi:hypothetical protein